MTVVLLRIPMGTKRKKAAPKCNAKTRAGGKCTRPRGWGTDHPGKGRCKLHGGLSLAGVDHPNYKHGRYAKSLTGRMKEKFDEAMADPDPLNLREDLALQRAILDEFVSSRKRWNDDNRNMAIFLSNQVVNTSVKIVNLRNQTALTENEIRFLQAGIVGLLDEFIPDSERRKVFITRLNALIPETAGPSGRG